MLTQAQKYYGHDSSGEMTVIRGIMPEPPEPFVDVDDDDAMMLHVEIMAGVIDQW